MMPFASTSAAALCCLAATAASAAPSSSSIPRKRAGPPAGYYPPADAGGSMLTAVFNTFPPGLGEPLNVIVSGHSHPDIIARGDAWVAWYNSVGFAGECLGQHLGDAQQANLGDGNGLLNQTEEERWAYGDLNFGTCQETINGGNHFRWWVQNGTSANSGAIFFATSYELPLKQGHDIVPNGYDLGRDLLVGNATVPGGTSSGNYSFLTTVEMVPGLLPVGADGVNHGIDLDGNVAVLTVNVTKFPPNADPSAALPRREKAVGLTAIAALATLAWLV